MTAMARHSDPSTSHAAAASVKRSRSQHMVLFAFDHTVGGATDEHLAWIVTIVLRVPLSDSRIRTARKELCDLGLVRSTGRTERLRSGRHATVWEVAS